MYYLMPDSLPQKNELRIHVLKKILHSGFGRDGSALRSTDCSFRGAGFDSQHPYRGSQPPVNPVSGICSVFLTFASRHTCRKNQ